MWSDILSVLVTTLFISVCVAIFKIRKRLVNRYVYPYFDYSFDVSGKRNVDLTNLIDMFLLDGNNRNLLDDYARQVDDWKEQAEKEINGIHFGWLRKQKQQQYESVLDDPHAYRFSAYREQTRYRQSNYVRTPYKVAVIDQQTQVSLEWLLDRCRRLEETDFEATLKDWNCRQQRKLLTPKLRKKIAERDNYTCQICGKYMPDGVGLHIDHIVPVVKGGKTVESNLQVLCSKCNGSKGGKITGRNPHL